ncbi:hypothetical protein [Paraburkholderia sp. C35]|uniref:hypothetical protein n=1 Tax=Paraburkholderia sp. C35 TaxID=2126993 RepID=UPI0013A58C39|nr:hypothetical protein [Paraburkholderia sp. C35]
MQLEEHAGQWAHCPISFEQSEEDKHASAEHLFHLNIMSRVMICVVWSWSLIETFWELSYETNSLHIGIIVLAKLVLSAFALGALFSSSAALIALAFSCVVSIVVISVTLPDMFSISRSFFYLSLIEVAAKVTLVVSIVCHYVADQFEDSQPQIWPVR